MSSLPSRPSSSQTSTTGPTTNLAYLKRDKNQYVSVIGGDGPSPEMRRKRGPRAEETGVAQCSRACPFGFERGRPKGG
jgi:hypothetical protein